MKQCSIYNKSLRFSRAVYGILALIAFATHNQWLLLAVSILMILRVFSTKIDIPYQFHALILRKLFKDKSSLSSRETAELKFVSGMTGILLLIGFLFIYYGKFVNFAWIYILIISLLIFLACFVGFCVATLMYVLFKKLFKI